MNVRITGASPSHPVAVAGPVTIPGDKSISHRALMLAAISGTRDQPAITEIRNLAPGEDVASTRRVLKQLGVRMETLATDTPGAIAVTVHGRGIASLRASPRPLDCGNSGTTARLMVGILTAVPGRHTLTGDESLSRRPMERVAEPLRLMGAQITATGPGGTLPLEIEGFEPGTLAAIDFTPTIASAQVKSAVLLAGLFSTGTTRITEPTPTRDHTERMLELAGIRPGDAGGSETRLTLPPRLDIPGDISAAAYFLVLGALAAAPGKALTIPNCGINPRRDGVLRALKRMGAAIEVVPSAGDDLWEAVATLTVRRSSLAAIDLDAPDIPDLIDELPVLAVAMTQAAGTSRVTGAAELRRKESDRIDAIVAGLSALGGDITAIPDGFIVRGPTPLISGAHSSPTILDPRGDHRIAMSLAVAATISQGVSAAPGQSVISNADCAAISDPGFWKRLAGAGAEIAW
jgi:3-phosphoshikimate 1-carboxyvinyltransferase